MISVRVSIDGVGRMNADIEIRSESPYGPPDNELLDAVVADAVRRAKAALAAESR